MSHKTLIVSVTAYTNPLESGITIKPKPLASNLTEVENVAIITKSINSSYKS